MIKLVHDRFTLAQLAIDDTQTVKDGRIFISKCGYFDLSNIHLLASTVDTVRQLYIGNINQDFYSMIKTSIENENFYIDGLFGILPYYIQRMSKVSGYRYKFQNNEIGVTVLLGSYYAKEDTEASHLKIELSPHFINQRGCNEVQNFLDSIARKCLIDSKPSGVAVHLALDIQNWTIPDDFEQNFSTYSRAKTEYNGISDFELTDLASASIKYGKKLIETLTYGRPCGLQSTIYRKDLQIVKVDKVDYFHDLWSKHPFFNKDQPVTRLEMRFHHSIIRDIGRFLDVPMESYLQISEHLSDIWRYALSKNRLDYDKKYINPVWQLFMEDALFLYPPNGLYIKRVKKNDISAVTKNLGLIIGNLVSLGARWGFTARQIKRQLQKLFIWPMIQEYYHQTGKDLETVIQESLKRRVIIGKAA